MERGGALGYTGVEPNGGILRRVPFRTSDRVAPEATMAHVYGVWADRTPKGMVVPGKGGVVMEEWAIKGCVSSSQWTKHWAGVVEEAVWLDMIEELKQRQRRHGREREGGASTKHGLQRGCWRRRIVSASRFCIEWIAKDEGCVRHCGPRGLDHG